MNGKKIAIVVMAGALIFSLERLIAQRSALRTSRAAARATGEHAVRPEGSGRGDSGRISRLGFRTGRADELERSGLPRSPGGVENQGALLHYLSRPIRFASGCRIVRPDERGRSGEVCRKSRPGCSD